MHRMRIKPDKALQTKHALQGTRNLFWPLTHLFNETGHFAEPKEAQIPRDERYQRRLSYRCQGERCCGSGRGGCWCWKGCCVKPGRGPPRGDARLEAPAARRPAPGAINSPCQTFLDSRAALRSTVCNSPGGCSARAWATVTRDAAVRTPLPAGLAAMRRDAAKPNPFQALGHFTPRTLTSLQRLRMLPMREGRPSLRATPAADADAQTAPQAVSGVTPVRDPRVRISVARSSSPAPRNEDDVQSPSSVAVMALQKLHAVGGWCSR